MRLQRVVQIVLGLVIVALVFPGCFDDEDIDQRMIVSPIGIDAGPGRKMIVTFRMPVIRMGGTETHGSEPEKNYITRTSTSDGIMPAIIDAQNRDEHSIFLGQCRSMIFGEAYARRGLKPALDFFNRLPTFPPNAYVVIGRPDAAVIQNIDWPEQELHSQNIRLFFSNRENRKFGIKRWSLYQAVNDPLKDPLIPIVVPSDGKTTIKLVGLAVFHNDRMVGELNEEEANILSLLEYPTQENRVVIPVSAPTSIGFQVVNGKKRISVQYRQGRPVFNYRFQFYVYLTETSMYKLPMDNRQIDKIQNITAGYLQQKMLAIFDRLRRMGSDPLNWGDNFRVKQRWHFNPNRWRQDMRKAEFNVAVKVFIERMGVLK